MQAGAPPGTQLAQAADRRKDLVKDFFRNALGLVQGGYIVLAEFMLDSEILRRSAEGKQPPVAIPEAAV
ncbi:hypothetical protein H9X99_18135 [Intestinimonas butyriciproducens]|nr:hypothetical protein [Intestinimonas butyriciproducens]